jgi:hypothetical protein
MLGVKRSHMDGRNTFDLPYLLEVLRLRFLSLTADLGRIII